MSVQHNKHSVSPQNGQENTSEAELSELTARMLDRSGRQQALNRLITICWAVIAGTFMLSYIVETIKGMRTIGYTLTFGATMLLPILVCLLRYLRHPDDEKYGVWVTFGYFVMYTFALLTGNTTMVFSYILPMLSFLVLLHWPALVAWSGAAALIVNLLSVYMRSLTGQITIENSCDVEIQIALILFCYAGAWLSSRMYERITRSNEEAFRRVLQQKNKISGLETVALFDKLTALGNRMAYDNAMEKIRRAGVPAGVVFCDANGLKYRNDHMGHQAGDELLFSIANRLRAHFRTADCYRISGDEFVVLIANLEESVFTVRAERFHADVWGDDLPMTAVGWFHSDDIGEAVKNAEIRMYADKKHFYELHPQYKR